MPYLFKMRAFRKFLKLLLGLLILPPLLYLILIIIGAAIPVNSDPETSSADVGIYLISNGMHTDIAVPLKNQYMDWTTIVSPQHTTSGWPTSNFVSFGWGDLEFYEKTPEWEDLTFKTAFKALFLESPAAVHTRFFDGVREGENTRSITIDSSQYRGLTDYIANTFQFDQQRKTQPVAGLHYSDDDVFYRAKGSLNLFYTCNTWVNDGLKQAGLKGCLWTPAVEGIFYHYRE